MDNHPDTTPICWSICFATTPNLCSAAMTAYTHVLLSVTVLPCRRSKQRNPSYFWMDIVFVQKHHLKKKALVWTLPKSVQ